MAANSKREPLQETLGATPSTVVHEIGKSPEPCKVKLEKNSRGYNWELSYSGAEFNEIIQKIQYANLQMLELYGGEGP
jgi:hypothetical protein